jgi:hypothetical protein
VCNEAGDQAQDDPANNAHHYGHPLGDRRSAVTKKADATKHPWVLRCVGLLINESPGRWPEYPLVSHPMTSMFFWEPSPFTAPRATHHNSPGRRSKDIFEIFYTMFVQTNALATIYGRTEK